MYISFSNKPERSERGVKKPGARTVSSTVVSLGVVSLLTDISSESVAAILPLYITGVLGLSTIAFGLLDGLYQGVSAIVRIAGGYASDRYDRPKWVAFVGYALAAVARVGLLFAAGFTMLTAVITADRIGKGIRTAPRDALITASSDPDNLGTSFGVHRTLDNIGAAIGPLLAFFILLIIPDGYHVIFVISLAFAMIGVVILGLIVPNVRTRATEEDPLETTPGTATAGSGQPEPAPRRRFDWSVLTTGSLRRVLAAAGILGLLTIGDGFVYLVLQSRSDFAAQWFPLLYVGTNVAFLAFAIPLGRLSDRIGRARVFVWGHGALLAAYVVAVLPVPDIAATVLCLAFLGGFYAATDGVLAALAAQLTTPETRGTGIAAAQTVVALARFASATGFGILWFAFGRDTSLIVVAVVLAVAIPLVAALLRPLLRAPERTAPVHAAEPAAEPHAADSVTADPATPDEIGDPAGEDRR
ncbi:MFS transporter [Microbacterium sp. CGR1]|uniref:MFS transporter n=1 Tax=Microbacterium sp. CGR1 TaxID=1696072 RepID=UPI003DA1DC1E